MKNNLIAINSKNVSLITAALVIAVYCFLPTVAFGQKGAKAAENCSAECQQDLAQAAAATAKYHREEAALADGFFSTQECVAVPNLGAMGVHYVNLARSMDTNVNSAEPEILLYEPMRNGKMRLVGVEYFAPVLVNGQPWFAPTPPRRFYSDAVLTDRCRDTKPDSRGITICTFGFGAIILLDYSRRLIRK